MSQNNFPMTISSDQLSTYTNKENFHWKTICYIWDILVNICLQIVDPDFGIRLQSLENISRTKKLFYDYENLVFFNHFQFQTENDIKLGLLMIFNITICK